MIKASRAHRTARSYGISQRIAQDDEGITIPEPIFFTTLGFVLGGIFWPAALAGSARLTDIAIGRVSGGRRQG